MKILHVVSGDINLGAAKGAMNLHKGLCDLGVDSYVLNNGSINLTDDKVINIRQSLIDRIKFFILSRIDRLLVKFIYKKNDRSFVSTGLFGSDITKQKVYKEADVIHFHWINLGLIKLSSIKKINKPIIWTMRDMWVFTGVCHYSMDCKKYIEKCCECPVLGSTKEVDLSTFIQSRKRKYYSSKITFVAISQWLREEAKKSYLMSDYDIQVVNNNVDVDLFVKVEKAKAQNYLNISSDKRIILIGAINLRNKYKGFEKFVECLNYLESNEYVIYSFGRSDGSLIKNMGFDFYDFGFVNDVEMLKCLYSLSDVFVFPSYYEAFGKTIIESMACGTPVVAYDNSGPSYIIDNKVDGYLAKAFCPEDLANGIQYVTKKCNYELMSNSAIKKTKKYSNQIASNQYLKIYKSVISS